MSNRLRFRLFSTIWPWPSFERFLGVKRELLRISAKDRMSWSERLFWNSWHGQRYARCAWARFNGFLPWHTQIGDGAVFPHQLNGIHIVHTAKIGDRCTIMQNVTIGERYGKRDGAVIGNDVFIGAGAQIIGPCVIGDGARIGAGVVLVNATIPPGAVIVNRSAYDLTNKRYVYPQD